jgi:acyl carrier protein
MKPTNFKEIVKQVIAQKAGLETREVLDDMFFEDDLNLGELEISEILEELEDEFKLDLLANQPEIASVKELLDLLQERLD